MYQRKLRCTDDPFTSSRWAIPRLFRGATLDGHPWRTDAVDTWMRAAVAGNVIRGRRGMAGIGMTVASPGSESEEFVTALIGDLLRSPDFRAVQRLKDTDVVVTTAADMHADLRSKEEKEHDYAKARILVVYDVSSEDKWPMFSLAPMISSRAYRALPTLVTMSDATLYALASPATCPHPTLWKVLDNWTMVVEIA